MAIRALMVDVDGVLVDGRPEDGGQWHSSIEEHFGFSADALHEHFFAPYWENVIVGRAELMADLTTALAKIAPQVKPEEFVAYWFRNDSRLVPGLLSELSLVRSAGVRVYLATNQEHLRAAYLMETLGLSEHVDGIFYSARLGAKKPDAGFFMNVQSAVAMNGEEMLLIDDSAANVEAARSAGWQAFHWTTHTAPEFLRELCR